jgi:hypothetical protein
MKKFVVKCKDAEFKTYGAYNNDMKAFQYVDAWRGTETVNLEEAEKIVANLNKIWESKKDPSPYNLKTIAF